MLVALVTQRGGCHAQETGFTQLVSCNMILQLRETTVSIPGWEVRSGLDRVSKAPNGAVVVVE